MKLLHKNVTQLDNNHKVCSLLRTSRIGPPMMVGSFHGNSLASCLFILPSTLAEAEAVVGDSVVLNPVKRI